MEKLPKKVDTWKTLVLTLKQKLLVVHTHTQHLMERQSLYDMLLMKMVSDQKVHIFQRHHQSQKPFNDHYNILLTAKDWIQTQMSMVNTTHNTITINNITHTIHNTIIIITIDSTNTIDTISFFFYADILILVNEYEHTKNTSHRKSLSYLHLFYVNVSYMFYALNYVNIVIILFKI